MWHWLAKKLKTLVVFSAKVASLPLVAYISLTLLQYPDPIEPIILMAFFYSWSFAVVTTIGGPNTIIDKETIQKLKNKRSQRNG